MGNFKLHRRSFARVLVVSAATFFSYGAALAQVNTPVNGFVIINPISVCASATNCAPFGVKCSTTNGVWSCPGTAVANSPSTADVNTPIGYVDGDKNVNLTRAFWAQAGIDVAFFPVQSYVSPTNTVPSSWNNIKDAVTGSTFTYSNSNFQTLHQVNVTCADGFVALTSPDFQALTQHGICTEHGGLSGTYSKLTNPPSAPSTAPPLAINGCSQAKPCGSIDPITHILIANSNALDVFFINTIVAPPGNSSAGLYGFSWVNGDGISIIGGAIRPPPRFDTLAHEIGHNLALNHVDFGASSDPINMLLLGTNRPTSSKSGCQPTTGTVSNPPPVYNGGALFNLDYITATFRPCVDVNGVPIGNMLADHLTPGTCSDLTTCGNQEGATALSPFINKTLPNNASAGGGAQSTSATRTSTITTSPSGALSITISASGDPNDPDVPDLAATIIALLPNDQLSFSGNSPVTQIGGTGCLKDLNGNFIIPVQNCVVTVTSVVKLTSQMVTGNPGCDSGTGGPPSSQCIKVTYSDGFGPGINVILAVSFNKDSGTIISQNLLTGAQYTAIDDKGFATTSRFVPVFGGFDANSQTPDLTTPNVILDPTKFQNASVKRLGPKLSKCTPPLAGLAFPTVKIKGQNVKVCPDGNLPDITACPASMPLCND